MRSSVARFAGALCLALMLLPGCGGSASSAKVENRPAPPASAFPSPNGRSVAQVLKTASAPSSYVITPAQSVFDKGRNRFSFSVYSRSHQKEVANAEVAIYVEKASASVTGGVASGPYPARVESLETVPAYTSSSTADDPLAEHTVYVTTVDLPSNGAWTIGALTKEHGKLTAKKMPPITVGKFNAVPGVGQRPPAIHTPTPASVGGDLSQLTTRIPPEHMNQVDFSTALGRKPVVLLFATPKFCQSRVCGSTVDEAAQVQHQFGNKVDFIHMEIYNDNNPSKRVRPQVRAFHLPSEPWLYVIDRRGTIRTRIEGPFNLQDLTNAVKGVAGA